MPSEQRVDMHALQRLVEADAETRRENAAMGGHTHDGGASRLLEQVKFFNYGKAGTVPPEWGKYVKELDPEWLEYQRLQAKFGKA